MDVEAKKAQARRLWIDDKAPNEIAHLIGESTTAGTVKGWLRAMDIPERPTRPGERPPEPPPRAGPPNDLRTRGNPDD